MAKVILISNGYSHCLFMYEIHVAFLFTGVKMTYIQGWPVNTGGGNSQ